MTTYSTAIPALVSVDPIHVCYRLSDPTRDRDAVGRNLLNTVSIEAEAIVSLPTEMAPGQAFGHRFWANRAYNGHAQSAGAVEFCKESIANQLESLGVELADDHSVFVFVGERGELASSSTTWKELGQ